MDAQDVETAKLVRETDDFIELEDGKVYYKNSPEYKQYIEKQNKN